jgi:hypothetical protein
METTDSSKTLLIIYYITRNHVPQDRSLTYRYIFLSIMSKMSNFSFKQIYSPTKAQGHTLWIEQIIYGLQYDTLLIKTSTSSDYVNIGTQYAITYKKNVVVNNYINIT